MIEFGKCFRCGKIKEIRAVQGSQICFDCIEPQQEEEKAVKPYQIPKISKKRQKQNREYLQARREYLSKNPICGVKGCSKEAVEIHHKAGRENERLVDSSNFLGVCSSHHRMIELAPEWAKENEYSTSRLKPKTK